MPCLAEGVEWPAAMPSPDLDALLAQTLADRRLSRGERRVLGELLAESAPEPHTLAALRSRIFAAAREEVRDLRDRDLLLWLEEVIKLLADAERFGPPPAACADACFSPGAACRERIQHLFDTAAFSSDICVFTITDDRITEAILRAHRRKVKIRVLTDVDKAADPGSDVDLLARAGVPVAYDSVDKHMHHKFALFDGAVLLTGSYNWTRSAAEANEENLIVTRDPPLVAAFREEFERLWKRYGP